MAVVYGSDIDKYNEVLMMFDEVFISSSHSHYVCCREELFDILNSRKAPFIYRMD